MEFLHKFLIFFLILILLLSILSIIELIATWKLYKKSGYKGWESIIPFYNNWILIKIADLNDWYYLTLFAPTICIIIELEEIMFLSYLIHLTTTFFVYYNISKKFNKDLFFTILLVIFPYIMIPILAFDKNNTYNPNIKVSKHGPINKNNISNNNYKQNTNINNNYLKYCTCCGNKLDNNANFCGYCGNKINENK